MEVDSITLNLLMSVIEHENDKDLKDSEVGRRVMDRHPHEVLAMVERYVHIWRDINAKSYYRARTTTEFVWVSDIKDATADYEESAKATQQKLRNEHRTDTELVPTNEPSKFVLRRKVRS